MIVTRGYGGKGSIVAFGLSRKVVEQALDIEAARAFVVTTRFPFIEPTVKQISLSGTDNNLFLQVLNYPTEFLINSSQAYLDVHSELINIRHDTSIIKLAVGDSGAKADLNDFLIQLVRN